MGLSNVAVSRLTMTWEVSSSQNTSPTWWTGLAFSFEHMQASVETYMVMNEHKSTPVGSLDCFPWAADPSAPLQTAFESHLKFQGSLPHGKLML